MNHSKAIEIFKEIQARPYRIPRTIDEKAQNCYFKGIELLQRLGVFGYTVRGRVGETYWDKAIIPADILDLIPGDIPSTHFFVEIYLDGVWRALDPSFQPSLEQYGFTIGSWENGKLCFPITKLYTQEESLAYQDQWFDPDYQRDFFTRSAPAWIALDQYFEGLC